MQNAAQAYYNTHVGTTGQGELVVLLYDGALRFLSQAREKIEQKDFAAKGSLLARALDIINELDCSLNLEAGGELARNLHQLYLVCNSRLVQVNIKMDIAQLDSVVDILTGLRGAFAQIVNTPEAKAAAATISAKQKVTMARPQTRAVAETPATSNIIPGVNVTTAMPRMPAQLAEGQRAPVAVAPRPGLPPVMSPMAPPVVSLGSSTPPPTQAPQVSQAPPTEHFTALSIAQLQPQPGAEENRGFAGKKLAAYGKQTL